MSVGQTALGGASPCPPPLLVLCDQTRRGLWLVWIQQTHRVGWSVGRDDGLGAQENSLDCLSLQPSLFKLKVWVNAVD